MQYGSGSIENGKNNSVKILETVGDDRHSSNTFMLIDTIRTHQSILHHSEPIPQTTKVHSELFVQLTARPTLTPTPHSEA